MYIVSDKLKVREVAHLSLLQLRVGTNKNLISHPKHMLLVLKKNRPIKHIVKLMSKNNIYNLMLFFVHLNLCTYQFFP